VGTAGETLARSVHRFFIDANWRVGREYQVQQFDPSSTLLQQQDMTWTSITFGNGTTFAYVATGITTDYAGGTSFSRRVDYATIPAPRAARSTAT